MKKRTVRALSALLTLIMLTAGLSLSAVGAKDSCPHENRELLQEAIPKCLPIDGDDEYHQVVTSRKYRCLDCGVYVYDVISTYTEKHKYSLVSVLSSQHDKSHPVHYYTELRRCACGSEIIVNVKKPCLGPPCQVPFD